ncbi:MAG TPA: ROK family protein [Allosphingosinicella sp.]|jgi:fructokinase|nr:ROK family protein [Allosphingosinicella sp.]
MLAGVELGGTKCICTLASRDGEIVAQETVPTTNPEETLGWIEAVLGRWKAERGFAALGIASFGPVDLDPASPTWGFITTTPKPGWAQADVALRLGRGFDVPLTFDTDVNGAALAEMKWGAGQRMADFSYITVGTGVGVGLIVNGAPTRGFGHSELGHIRVARLPGDDWPGACPYHGACVEGLVAGGSIAKRLGGSAAGFGEDHPVWETVAHALAQLCHVLVCAAAPRRIVIGGGVVSGHPHLLPRIERMLLESLAGYVLLPPGPYLTAPGLGARAGPLGPIALAAAALGDQ